MKNVLYILIMVSLLLSCNSRKNANDTNPNGMEDVVRDSMRPDSLHHPSPDEFTDGHMPPPPPPDGKHSDGRHLHHLTEKAVLPISLTICEASTLHRKMTWKTMV